MYILSPTSVLHGACMAVLPLVAFLTLSLLLSLEGRLWLLGPTFFADLMCA